MIRGLVSLADDGRQGNGRSENVWASVSGDGRRVVFNSRATNLVRGRIGRAAHLYVRDLANSTTELVDVSSDGTPGNADSFGATISADGRWAAFTSDATNLVEGKSTDAFDVYAHDRETGVTKRVSLAADGRPGNAMSFRAQISGNGRFVTFVSMASNLIPGQAGGISTCFVYDLLADTLEMVTVNSDGEPADGLCQAPSISSDGRFVAFTSRATNLAPGQASGIWNVYVRDRERRTTTLVSDGMTGGLGGGSAGAELAGPGQSPLTARGSLGDSISPDGRYVAFGSWVSHLIPGDRNDTLSLYLRDLADGTTEKISVAHDGGQADDMTFFTASVSAGGRYVAFASRATNLVPGDSHPGLWHVYLRDRELSTTERISVAPDGAKANGESAYPVISADGSTIAFISAAANLVANDSNGQMDVFFWTRGSG